MFSDAALLTEQAGRRSAGNIGEDGDGQPTRQREGMPIQLAIDSAAMIFIEESRRRRELLHEKLALLKLLDMLERHHLQ